VTDAAVVRTTGLSKRYGRLEALSDVTLGIEAGEVFGYLGPNGAGKTTTLRLLMGMIRPTAGSATVLGLDAWRDSVAVHRRVGYLQGEAALYDKLTGRQHIAYFCHCAVLPANPAPSSSPSASTSTWTIPPGRCPRGTGRR
jgi:ABC-2 type transport system ATP-binding protein